jgi:hypothetical protein
VGRLRSAFDLAGYASRGAPGAAVTPIRSPWSPRTLETVVWSDIFGSADLPVMRSEAMSVPSVAKARHLIVGLSRQPVRAYRGADPVSDPVWTYRTDSQTPPTTRMLWTLDDLYFGGWALWAVDRGQGDTILDAVRVPPERWGFDPDGAVLVDGVGVDADQVILFSGPYEGLLAAGAGTVRAARNLETAWAKRVRTPVPITELHQVNEDPMTAEEIHDTVESWSAMIEAGGGVGFTPYNVEAKYPGGVLGPVHRSS